MIVPKCLVLAIGVFIGVQAVNKMIYSRKKLVNGIPFTETWTRNELYLEYTKKYDGGTPLTYTEVQRLAPNGSLEFYVFGHSHGTPFTRTVWGFKRLNRTASDDELGPFAEEVYPPGRKICYLPQPPKLVGSLIMGGAEGGISTLGCVRGRYGPNCQLIAVNPVQDYDASLDNIGLNPCRSSPLRKRLNRPSRALISRKIYHRLD